MCLHCSCFTVPLLHKVYCSVKVSVAELHRMCVSKLKGGKKFSVAIYMLRDSLPSSFPLPSPTSFPLLLWRSSSSDLSCFHSTLQFPVSKVQRKKVKFFLSLITRRVLKKYVDVSAGVSHLDIIYDTVNHWKK